MEAEGGIDAPGVIDQVRVPPDGPVELVVVQPGGWDGSDHRLLLLQEKLNRYLEYVIDGELTVEHPHAAGRPWFVVVETVTSPDRRTAEYLRHADRELGGSGGGCRVRVVGRPAG